jgi:RNA polymerase sigma factor (sigma-70 family)
MNFEQNNQSSLHAQIYTQAAYANYFSLVVFVLRKMRLREEECEDIAQEVFVRYYKQVHNVNENSVKAWLVTTARNLALDKFRQAKTRRTDVCQDAIGNSARSLWKEEDESERQASREKMLTLLEEQAKEPKNGILSDFYLEAKSTKTIAAERGLKVSSVTCALSRQRGRFLDAARAEWN